VRISRLDILTFDGFSDSESDILKPRWLPTSTISNRKGTQATMSSKTTDKRLKYGFGEFNRGDAWRYYNVPLERVRNAAQMFGQRHGMKFRVRQSAKAVLVERLA
jgi:hypothetical protein